MNLSNIRVKKEINENSNDIEFTYVAEVVNKAKFTVKMSQYVDAIKKTKKTKDELEKEVELRLRVQLLNALIGDVHKQINELKDTVMNNEIEAALDAIIDQVYTPKPKEEND